MTMRRGRCNNLGLCENATRQRTIEVADGQPFVCPKCGAELVSVADRPSTRKASSLVLPLAAITLAVVAVGYKVWDLYGSHAAPVALVSQAPLPPQAAPEPAPVPAAGPAAPPASVPAATAPAAPAPGAAGAAAVQAPPAAAPATPEPQPAAVPLAAAAPALPVVTPPPVQGAQVATPQAVEPPPAAPVPAAPPIAAASPAADPAERVHAFLGGATRVPVTLAFRSGAVALTGRSEQDVARLVGYLRQHHATGEHIYLAGFTDNQGDAASNDAVAQKRVTAVAAALTQAGLPPAHVASFGADLPVADNATQAGRDRNRRVEVYLGQ